MTSFFQDLRFGVRTFLTRPGFTFVAVLTLALGIGANTAIFSVINAVLLRSLPYPQEEQLVVLREKRGGEEERVTNSASFLNFRDWQARSQSFQSMAIVERSEATLTGEGEPARVQLAVTSAEIFSVLGLQPLLGRAFTAAEEAPGGTDGFNSVILSHALWQQRFGASRKIIGQKITLDDNAHTVVGVMPPGVFPLQNELVDCWVTVAAGGDPAKPGTMNSSRGYRAYLAVLARLKPGVTITQAQAEMTSLAQALAAQYPAQNKNYETSVVALRSLLVGKVTRLLWLLLGIVGAVLLIACANVANLLLARATTRHREMAIRAVLGASRWQIVRQLLLESLLLAACGGAVGLLFSLWGVDLLVAALPAEVPRLTGLAPDWRVLLFTLGAALLTGVLCGLAPALSASRHDLSVAMKEGGRNTTSARGRLRSALVIGQVAIALVLLVGAGLLLKSFWLLQRVDPGFDYRHLLTAKVVLPTERYQEAARAKAFYDTLLGNLKALPGVTQVSLAQSIPLTGADNGTAFTLVGHPTVPGEEREARLRFIGLNYFSTVTIPQLAGRDFTARDDAQAPPVLIVNDAFVRRYFNGEDPLGKKLLLGWGGDEPKEIVGVVADVRHRGLDDQPRPEMYVPQAQFNTLDLTLLVKTTSAPETLIQSLTAEVRKLDAELPITDIKTLAQYRAETVALPRFNLLVLTLFALLALGLTVIGLYGVMAYAVSQRTNEIGVRMALGAQPLDILRMVLQQGLALVFIGIALGLVGAWAATRVLRSLLFEVQVTDPLTFFSVALLLTLVAVLASFLPAYRATKVDPVIALRYE